jgi:hypothetical protein
MPYPKCKEFCASTGVRHEEAKLKDQGSGLLEFKGQGPEMVNVEELCWCVRPYPKNVHQPWPLALKYGAPTTGSKTGEGEAGGATR